MLPEEHETASKNDELVFHVVHRPPKCWARAVALGPLPVSGTLFLIPQLPGSAGINDTWPM